MVTKLLSDEKVETMFSVMLLIYGKQKLLWEKWEEIPDICFYFYQLHDAKMLCY